MMKMKITAGTISVCAAGTQNRAMRHIMDPEANNDHISDASHDIKDQQIVAKSREIKLTEFL